MNCEQLKLAAHAYFTRTLPAAERRAFDEHGDSCEACAEFLRVCRETTCREVNEFLDRYIDGELSEDRRAVFERHLAICADCRSYLATYRATLRSAQRALSDAELGLPASVPEELVQAILAASQRAP